MIPLIQGSHSPNVMKKWTSTAANEATINSSWEVATDIFAGILSTSIITGTLMMPPPMPKKAAMKPATTAIPAAKPVKPVKPDPRTADPRTPDPRAPGDDSAAAPRAIPTQRKSDADAATDKLNAPAEDEPQRRGTSGLSAQDLLRREGRLK